MILSAKFEKGQVFKALRQISRTDLAKNKDITQT